MKTWMVEQQHKLGDMYVPIRSVVQAKTRKQAQKGAAEACKKANEHLAQKHGTEPAEPQGEAIVLYPIDL